MARARLRELGIIIGNMPTGAHNAITDVPGVTVGHSTLIYDQPRIARTGVTVILPRENDIWRNNVYGGCFSFNGNGEMTGLPWLEESGLIGTPIAITNTHQVGLVRDALIAYEIEQHPDSDWLLPIVAETYDGFLNDIDAFHLKAEHVFAAIRAARGGPVPEGSVGGGTGMICHGFKGGIGTASRIIQQGRSRYTVGVLAQANYGARHHLRVDGVPVGRELPPQHTPEPGQPSGSSIIVVIATDAPLLADQCKRLARRATVGLARVGGIGGNSSGDIFLAFATGNTLPSEPPDTAGIPLLPVHTIPAAALNPFFEAVAEATEEAILNALTAAETMTGFQGRVVHALPLDDLRRIMARYGRIR